MFICAICGKRKKNPRIETSRETPAFAPTGLNVFLLRIRRALPYAIAYRAVGAQLRLWRKRPRSGRISVNRGATMRSIASCGNGTNKNRLRRRRTAREFGRSREVRLLRRRVVFHAVSVGLARSRAHPTVSISSPASRTGTHFIFASGKNHTSLLNSSTFSTPQLFFRVPAKKTLDTARPFYKITLNKRDGSPPQNILNTTTPIQ